MPKANPSKVPNVVDRHDIPNIGQTVSEAPAVAGHAPKASPHKLAIVVALLKRAEGASIGELAGATGWKTNSVRALMSRAVKKKQIKTITSDKLDGARMYRFAG